jgi:hypothetical protein
MADENFLARLWKALRSFAGLPGPSRIDLDGFGEVYKGFDRDRQRLKAAVDDPNSVWREAFERMRRTEELYQCSTDAVARETMRVLMEWLPE